MSDEQNKVANECLYVTVARDPDDPQGVPFACSAWHEFQIEDNPVGFEAHLECLYNEHGNGNIRTVIIEIEPDWMQGVFEPPRTKGKAVGTISASDH